MHLTPSHRFYFQPHFYQLQINFCENLEERKKEVPCEESIKVLSSVISVRQRL
jgi:hypothetical protein